MTLPNFTTLTRDEALAFILSGMQTKRAEIDATLRDLRSQLDADAVRLDGSWDTAQDALERQSVLSPKPPRRFSAATRKRMAEAQRARWAKRKGN